MHRIPHNPVLCGFIKQLRIYGYVLNRKKTAKYVFIPGGIFLQKAFAAFLYFAHTRFSLKIISDGNAVSKKQVLSMRTGHSIKSKGRSNAEPFFQFYRQADIG